MLPVTLFSNDHERHLTTMTNVILSLWKDIDFFVCGNVG